MTDHDHDHECQSCWMIQLGLEDGKFVVRAYYGHDDARELVAVAGPFDTESQAMSRGRMVAAEFDAAMTAGASLPDDVAEFLRLQPDYRIPEPIA